MTSLNHVPPLDIMMFDDQQPYPDQIQNYPSSAPQQQIRPSPEYPDSYQRQFSLQPQAKGTEMYKHPSPVGSYHAHSMSPYNNAAASQQVQTQFSPEFTSFQHPSVLEPTSTNLSSCSCTENTAADAQQQYTPSSWTPVSSSITGYPSSPATGGCDWNAYQSTDGFPNNSNPAGFPTFTGSATATYAMTDAIPTFEDFTTGYQKVPTQMFHGGMEQQGVIGLDRQMRCSCEWAKASGTYRVNPQTGKTRTKDKYRVVYTDHQRFQLEKEFYYSRYITVTRKSQLSVTLGLSERQVKIWFQNRRAKERRQNKTRAGIPAEQEPDQQDNFIDQDDIMPRIPIGLVFPSGKDITRNPLLTFK